MLAIAVLDIELWPMEKAFGAIKNTERSQAQVTEYCAFGATRRIAYTHGPKRSCIHSAACSEFAPRGHARELRAARNRRTRPTRPNCMLM